MSFDERIDHAILLTSCCTHTTISKHSGNSKQIVRLRVIILGNSHAVKMWNMAMWIAKWKNTFLLVDVGVYICSLALRFFVLMLVRDDRRDVAVPWNIVSY